MTTFPDQYDLDLIIIGPATNKHRTKLKDNQFFALMVEDYYGKRDRHESEFFDYERGWVGLERPSGGKACYLSKRYGARSSSDRGVCLIVQTGNANRHFILP